LLGLEKRRLSGKLITAYTFLMEGATEEELLISSDEWR